MINLNKLFSSKIDHRMLFCMYSGSMWSVHVNYSKCYSRFRRSSKLIQIGSPVELRQILCVELVIHLLVYYRGQIMRMHIAILSFSIQVLKLRLDVVRQSRAS